MSIKLTATEPPFEGRPRGEIPEAGSDQLAGYEFHQYELGKLARGEGIHVALAQQGVDLGIQIVNDAGGVELFIDSPTGANGLEEICFVAPSAGRFQLFVGPLEAEEAGPYAIRVIERASKLANARIVDCVTGRRAFDQAQQLRSTQPAEAMALYDKAIEHWRRSRVDFSLALALKQAGSLAVLRGEIESALTAYAEAMTLFRTVDYYGAKSDGDLHQVASVLNLSGLAHKRAGALLQARRAFVEARTAAGSVSYREGVAAAISNLASWEEVAGDLYRAVELHREALVIWRDLGLAPEEATTLNGLGVALSRLGLYGEALDRLEEALAIRQQEKRGDLLANTWLTIGWVKHLSGQGEEALGDFWRAIRLYREHGSRLNEAGALDRLGSAFRKIGRSKFAQQAYEIALSIYRASDDRVHTAHTASNLGCLLGDPALLKEAAEIFEGFGDRAALAHVRFCQAHEERSADRLNAALHRTDEAAALVEDLRINALQRGYPSPELRLWQEYSELQVDVLMSLHDRLPEADHAVRAFEVSDLTRARHLYEMLLEAQVEVRSGVPDELLERERVLQHQLNDIELRRQALAADGGTGLAELQKDLRQSLRQLQDIRAAIRSASPRFAELRQPTPTQLEEVQALLAPDTLLLSYVLGEERSYLFAVRHDGLESHVLPPRRQVDALAWKVYSGMRSSHQRRTRQQLPIYAEQLAEILLAPVVEQLAGRRLLVVGDGLLHYVPFAALPLGGEDPVAERHSVVHLPSVAVAKALRERAVERRRPAKELAVIANAVYTATDDRLPATRTVPAVPDPLPHLPYTAQEAEAISTLVPPSQRLVATGFAARPELIRQGVLRDYRIVHLATHGLLHEDHPELSGVAFSMFDEAGATKDGYLRLHEIYALELPADLVVLSACRTALTREAEGAGLVGLTHGFFYAGASRLLVSLWDVHDEATAELMAAFYRGLYSEGLTPPDALRAAQRFLRRQERWQAPYYWAGFVLEGDWGPR